MLSTVSIHRVCGASMRWLRLYVGGQKPNVE
jgi:hypothetical protein